MKPQADPGAEQAYEIVQRVDEKLSSQARRSWRWRLLYLRALLDAELKGNDKASTSINDRSAKTPSRKEIRVDLLIPCALRLRGRIPLAWI